MTFRALFSIYLDISMVLAIIVLAYYLFEKKLSKTKDHKFGYLLDTWDGFYMVIFFTVLVGMPFINLYFACVMLYAQAMEILSKLYIVRLFSKFTTLENPWFKIVTTPCPVCQRDATPPVMATQQAPDQNGKEHGVYVLVCSSNTCAHSEHGVQATVAAKKWSDKYIMNHGTWFDKWICKRGGWITHHDFRLKDEQHTDH